LRLLLLLLLLLLTRRGCRAASSVIDAAAAADVGGDVGIAQQLQGGVHLALKSMQACIGGVCA
jgi:hypothetical protein